MPSLATTPQTSRDYARLLLVMRKLIRVEFDVNIAIDQPETTTLLIHYARRSEETLLHEMADELEELLAEPPASAPAGHSAAPAHDEQRYRGAVLSHPVGQEEPGKKVKRVYRGRVIEE